MKRRFAGVHSALVRAVATERTEHLAAQLNKLPDAVAGMFIKLK
jgi:hypothetical protein